MEIPEHCFETRSEYRDGMWHLIVRWKHLEVMQWLSRLWCRRK